MSSLAIVQSLKESILAANVKSVYGDPITAGGKKARRRTRSRYRARHVAKLA